MRRAGRAPGPAAGAFDLLVLAGGEGRRLGGADKAGVVVAGRTLLDHVLDAGRGARRVVVVGPAHLAREAGPDHPAVATVLEDPPRGGPVAGIAAGLAVLDAVVPGREPTPGDVPVVVLPCDAPRSPGAVDALLAALAEVPDADGAQLVDPDGRGQHLVAAYRRPALARALAALPAGPRGVAVRRLVADLTLAGVPDPAGLAEDADTWDAVERLDATMTGRSAMTLTPHEPVGDDLHRWVAHLAEELGVDPDAVDVEAVLDLAREAAHGVARPAVPLTAFLLGVAVARGGGDRAAFVREAERVTGLARAWAAGAGPAA